jgi:two-component system KDP operon response regulator KdpE
MSVQLLLAAAGDHRQLVDDLATAGFAVACEPPLSAAVRHVLLRRPDAVLVPAGADGVAQLCEVLRALGPIPLIVIATESSPARMAECLDRGADAIVTMPLSPHELAARIRAVLRRAADQPAVSSDVLAVGDLAIDTGARTVRRRGVPVDLSPTEYRLLLLLAERVDRVVANEDLLTYVWGAEYINDLHYVRLYISYLRTKLEDDPRHPRLILNHRGVGYRLASSPAEPVEV